MYTYKKVIVPCARHDVDVLFAKLMSHGVAIWGAGQVDKYGVAPVVTQNGVR